MLENGLGRLLNYTLVVRLKIVDVNKILRLYNNACVIKEKGMAYARERIREAVKLYFSGAPEDCRRERDSITELLLRILPLFEN